VGGIVAAPREQEVHLRQAARADGDARRIAIVQVVEVHVAAGERHLALIGNEVKSEWPPDGMLESLAYQKQVRGAEAIVRVARQETVAINVRAAQGRLEVERLHASTIGDGLRQHKTHADCALPIPGEGRGGTFPADRSRALVGSIKFLRPWRSLAIDREHMAKVACPAPERVG